MNTWTTILTPTELEKTFAPKKASGNKPIEVRTASGAIKRFDSTREAALGIGISKSTVAKLCQERRADKQGNHYRYI